MNAESALVLKLPAENADASSRWIPADRLGLSARHTSRLFNELTPLGAARKLGTTRMIDRNHPEVSKRIAKSEVDRSYEVLQEGRYTQKQIDSARRWMKIIVASRRDVSAFMSERGVG
ncbi:MAG: hypothetical protein DHS20C16_14850 [Phycisphaerae bacterium]|nr:MAG: hypothetical protein DHS20C16_14850 [Phycisphaerae bacterium]